MEATWTLQDAKNRFSAVVDAAARGEPQKVTRRGKWVSVVLSAEDDQRLQRLDAANAPSLNELLLQMPQDDESFERMPQTPREFPCS
jgi:prevent-host-death family protein